MVTVCLIRIHFLTLFVDYINYMMQWPLQCNRGQNGNGAVLVFTDQCTLGGTGP